LAARRPASLVILHGNILLTSVRAAAIIVFAFFEQDLKFRR